jgi:hypothetical protein
MKKLLIIGFFAAGAALADEAKVQGTSRVTSEVLKIFLRDEKVHIEHFTGVKTWPSGDNYKSKVYLHGNDVLSYECMEHHQGDQIHIMCDKVESN